MSLNALLIGYGFIAQGHEAHYRTNGQVTIAGVVDHSPQRRQAAERRGLTVFADVATAVRELDIDFVDICTPPTSHAGYLTMALEHGVSALCEKPMFVNGSAVEADIFDRSIDGDVFAFPVHNYRFAPVFRRLQQVADEHPGGPAFGEVRVVRSGHARGVVDWLPDWRRDNAIANGGILTDHGPHAIYTAEMMAGSRVEAVSAWLHFESADSDNETTVNLRLRFANGASTTVFLTWEADTRESHYAMIFDDGFVTVDDDRIHSTVPGSRFVEDVRSDFNDASHSSWFGGVLDEYLSAHHDKELRRSRLVEARRVQRCISAAYSSASDNARWQVVES
ncbi:Gfo/Idh/MocA family oxidoreductase [Actinosynnema sp. NPDC050801]|uniref:Gfo/Idh/MocA family protein n=1 Tax=unclassified Actinosynnema TaxID=2637065 RepID=UPI0033C913B0